MKSLELIEYLLILGVTIANLFACLVVRRKNAAEAAAASRNARQKGVYEWVRNTFGLANAETKERARRFVEEAMELAQAEGLTLAEVASLANYVYHRTPGEPWSEAGGVGTTLLAYCEAKGFSADAAEKAEFDRVLAADVVTFRLRHDAKAVAGVAEFVDRTTGKQSSPNPIPPNVPSNKLPKPPLPSKPEFVGAKEKRDADGYNTEHDD